MAQTKIPFILGTTLVLCMFFCCRTTQQAETTYMVGDDRGWTFGVSDWPDGKSFKAGDILVFMYDRAKHDVVVVRDHDQHDYDSCTVPEVLAGWYQTGYDEIKLEQGITFFISSYPQNCASGMKLAINITA
ncbi:hypothetical protein I3843_05G040700 [Carya illinoinensis]|nr:hypothetical protein I3760_05G044400 [Carya illinoinensis]KAG7977646.1 hypothetical protein I3843_05G040700 [Carya illinoinensis]